MTTLFTAYNQEILPLIRTLNEKKEILKESKKALADDNQELVEIQQHIKKWKDLEKAFYETELTGEIEEIKSLNKEIGEAVTAATEAAQRETDNELLEKKVVKKFFTLRAKEELEPAFVVNDLLVGLDSVVAN